MSTATRRRGPRTPWALAVVVLALVEVLVFIAVAHLIGAWPTIALLVVESVIGGWLVRRKGRQARAALRGASAQGRVPSAELADAALVGLGGFLLILPGFVTDLAGLFLLTPFARPLGRRLVARMAARQVRTAAPGMGSFTVIGGPGFSGATFGSPFGAASARGGYGPGGAQRPSDQQPQRPRPEPGSIGPDGVIEGEIL